MAFLLPYSLITNGIYHMLVTSIGTVTAGTYKIISSIYNHKNTNVDQFIKKLDIERKLALIESVLKYKKKTKLEDQSDQSENQSESESIFKQETTHLEETISESSIHPVHLCLTDLSDIITIIHTNLKEIDRRVKRHNAKWFKSYRYLNITKELDQLETNVGILDARFNDLIKISGLIRD